MSMLNNTPTVHPYVSHFEPTLGLRNVTKSELKKFMNYGSYFYIYQFYNKMRSSQKNYLFYMTCEKRKIDLIPDALRCHYEFRLIRMRN